MQFSNPSLRNFSDTAAHLRFKSALLFFMSKEILYHCNRISFGGLCSCGKRSMPAKAMPAIVCFLAISNSPPLHSTGNTRQAIIFSHATPDEVKKELHHIGCPISICRIIVYQHCIISIAHKVRHFFCTQTTESQQSSMSFIPYCQQASF